MNKYVKEACVESLGQLFDAQQKGADRIELCDRLDLGGTTPAKSIILAAKENPLPLRVMIRPRGGNFIYNKKELAEMKDTIRFCKELGVEGVVFGIQYKNGNLDYDKIATFAQLASPLKVVIHKAIDETTDPIDAVRRIKQIGGISSILTSGGMSTAWEGRENLKKMIAVADSELEIVAAGKVTAENISVLNDFLKAPLITEG